MKRVTVRNITHNYPAEESIKKVLYFIGKTFGDRWNDNMYEIRSTGANIISKISAENKDGGDTIVFEISDLNAEKYLDIILDGWYHYTIEEI